MARLLAETSCALLSKRLDLSGLRVRHLRGGGETAARVGGNVSPGR